MEWCILLRKARRSRRKEPTGGIVTAMISASRKGHTANVRRFGAQLVLIAVIFSALLYAGLYTELKADTDRALKTEGASYINLLVNVGEWTAWHSSGELQSERAADGTNVAFRLIDLEPLNPVYLADEWETQALEAFYAGSSSSASRVEETSSGDVYHYMEPVLIQQECLGCHADYKIGSPRGAISVEIPMDSVQERISAGRLIYGAFSLMALLAMVGGGSFFLATFHRSLDASNRRLEEMAVTDELTGAPNRRAMLETLEMEFERSGRTGDPLSLILLDVDHFKEVNDTLGHAAGDTVLVELARRARASIRPYDTFGRMGGEEFLVVAPGTAPSEADRLAERILETVRSSAFSGPDNDISVTVSAGVSSLSVDDSGVDSLLARADEALYAAKDGGRDRVMSAQE